MSNKRVLLCNKELNGLGHISPCKCTSAENGKEKEHSTTTQSRREYAALSELLPWGPGGGTLRERENDPDTFNSTISFEAKNKKGKNKKSNNSLTK